MIIIVSIQNDNLHAIDARFALIDNVQGGAAGVIEGGRYDETIPLLVRRLSQNSFFHIVADEVGVIEAAVIVAVLDGLDVDGLTGIPVGSLQGRKQGDGVGT